MTISKFQIVSSMRILSSILLLLVLKGVKAGDGPAYPDTCDYDWGAMCGDQCIGMGNKCYCGSDLQTGIFWPYFDNEHCCLEPGETCTTDQNGDVFCNEGMKVSKSSACNTTMGPRCYNSYQHSQYIGHQAHYTCHDTCVPWDEMCQGVSQCT